MSPVPRQCLTNLGYLFFALHQRRNCRRETLRQGIGAFLSPGRRHLLPYRNRRVPLGHLSRHTVIALLHMRNRRGLLGQALPEILPLRE
jgi:hypothetical protein